jgi:hypothetical protein
MAAVQARNTRNGIYFWLFWQRICKPHLGHLTRTLNPSQTLQETSQALMSDRLHLRRSPLIAFAAFSSRP